MSMTQVRSLMTDMKLHGMATVLEPTLLEARKEDWSTEETLDALLQAELDHRQRRLVERRIKNSKLKHQASFEDFDFTARRSITKAQINELYSLKWLEQGRPVILVGQTGVGKSFIAQATGMHACQKGYSTLFLSVSHFLEELNLARSTGTYLKFRTKMIKPDLLILDDFGMRKFTDVEAEDLREMVEERSYGKSTLVTTQLPPDHWSEVISDPVLAEALTDRFEGPGIIYRITGESYRKVKAKKLAGRGKSK